MFTFSHPYPGTSGSYNRTGLPPGTYNLRVEVRDRSQVAVARTMIPVLAPLTCNAYLINRGISVIGNTTTIEFTGTGAGRFRCFLDRSREFTDPCELMPQSLIVNVHIIMLHTVNSRK